MLTDAVLHTVVVLVGLIVYAVLSALGTDGNPALAAALAWGSGAATQAGLTKRNGAP